MDAKRISRAVIALFLTIQLGLYSTAAAAFPLQDNALGTWTDAFTDAGGISSATNTGVDTASGELKLTNAGGSFAPPYSSSGSIITTTIIPLSVARWQSVSWSGSVPTGTSIKVQVLDEANYLYPDSLVPGNSLGSESSPLDLGGLPVERTANSFGAAKFARLRLKVTLSTSDQNVTPALDSLTLSWVVRQGDLSASPLANTAWPIQDGNKRALRRSMATKSIYPALRWVNEQGHNLFQTTTRGFGSTLFNKTAGGFTDPSNPSEVLDGQLSALNRNTGATVWKRPVSGFSFSDTAHSLSQNGTLYLSDIFSDVLLAYDTNTASLKWTYQFYAGHGNENTTVGDDGTIYTVRVTDADKMFTVWAFRPDGSVKWTSSYSQPGQQQIACSQLAIGLDGKLYMGTSVYTPAGYTGDGSLFAFNASDGAIAWQYPTGGIYRITPVIGNGGQIFVANTETTATAKAIFSISPNGTLRWQRSLGTTTDRWMRLALRGDGDLLAERRSVYPSTDGAVEGVSVDGGSLMWSVPVVSDDFWEGNLLADAANGFFVTSALFNVETNLYYYDSTRRQRWALRRHGAPQTLTWSGFIQDEDRWLFGILKNFDTFTSQLVAIAPWRIIVTPPGTSTPGSDLTFEATTTMQATSPLSGGANQMQVVVDNGDVVTLSYVQTDASGNTRWTGLYRLPEAITGGVHSFRVEANAADIRTDIPVNFSSPAANSENTGLTADGTFTVQRP